MSWLPSRLLLALLTQAFRVTHKTIRGWRQVAIVAIFHELVSQGFFYVVANASLHVLLVQCVQTRQNVIFAKPVEYLLSSDVEWPVTRLMYKKATYSHAIASDRPPGWISFRGSYPASCPPVCATGAEHPDAAPNCYTVRLARGKGSDDS